MTALAKNIIIISSMFFVYKKEYNYEIWMLVFAGINFFLFLFYSCYYCTLSFRGKGY